MRKRGLPRTTFEVRKVPPGSDTLAFGEGWDREDGMAGAMRRLGVEPIPGSRHHRGCDDAAEIARLLGRVLGEGGVS